MAKNLEGLKQRLINRWMDEDYPGATPRFQLSLLAKDVLTFGVLPISAIAFYKIAESSLTSSSRPSIKKRIERVEGNEKRSQIIQFQTNRASGGSVGFTKRAPGTIVRVRLLNSVETYSNSPVHAQIVDGGLGREFIGATIVGDATPDPSISRINISFKFVRHPKRLDTAVAINARAMSLDGTFGINALRKEGLFARAAIRSATASPDGSDSTSDNQDFKTLVVRAVAAGLMQEFQAESSIAHNKAQVLVLKPLTEFFVEPTDYFPGQK